MLEFSIKMDRQILNFFLYIENPNYGLQLLKKKSLGIKLQHS